MTSLKRVPVRTRVGHSFIKQVMAETGAVFGGEHSGHYYFRDNYRADSGLIAAVLVLEQLSEAGIPLSNLLEPFRRYRDSGEINSRVADRRGTMERIAAGLRDISEAGADEAILVVSTITERSIRALGEALATLDA